MTIGELALGDFFTTDNFGAPGGVWVLVSRDTIAYCANLTTPDEETFGLDEECERTSVPLGWTS